MKLLVLTTRLFEVPRSGGEICTSRLLEGLRDAGHDIVLAGRGDPAAAANWARTVVSLGDVEPPFDEQATLRRLRAVLFALLAGEPITVHRQGSWRAHAEIAPHLASCDAVVVDHLQTWPWLAGRHDKPVMVLNHNVESDNYMRHSRAANRGCHGHPSTRPATRFLMRREAYGLRALELEVLDKAAVVACLSEGDAQRLQALAGQARQAVRARVLVLPGYPRERRPGVRSRRVGEAPAIGLIGTWTWAPNRQGLRWLLDRVWPAIGDRARLVLAGGGLEGMSLPAGTRVLGRVADVQSFYDAVDVVAIPSLSGSGVQEKAIEAIGTGLPVVATTHALRGLTQALPAQVCMADNPAVFAQACLAASASAAAPPQVTVQDWATRRRLEYAQALAECASALRRDEVHGSGLALGCATAAS
jgi:polysaccharide biosynthesis protein PslH